VIWTNEAALLTTTLDEGTGPMATDVRESAKFARFVTNREYRAVNDIESDEVTGFCQFRDMSYTNPISIKDAVQLHLEHCFRAVHGWR
jgi:hypothetical protein